MSQTIDISALFDKPEPLQKASLFIEPIAPLSLVTSMPGAYYRSQREPSDFMIYGMLENLLGWHFTNDERNPIIRNLKSHFKKKFKLNLDFNKTPVGYKPLIQHHLKIDQLLLKPFCESYEDYWTQHLRDEDERHAKGTRNYDYTIEQSVNDIYASDKDKRDGKWKNLFDKNKNGKFPAYYQSPAKREFIQVHGKYGYLILGSISLLDKLIQSIINLDNPLYLGTNEGWVNLNIELI